MTKPPETHIEPAAVAASHRDRLLSPARYRHPGDVIRLIIAGLVLAGALTVTAAAHATYAGPSATAVTAVAPSTLAGRVLAGLVQAAFAAAAAVAVAVTLGYRRYRLLAGLAGSAVLAGAVVIGITQLAGGQRPRTQAAGPGPWPWVTGASLAGPALGAAAVACAVAAAPWLARPWRRAAWVALRLAAVAWLITGTASPVEVVLAFAAGVTAGAVAVLTMDRVDGRSLDLIPAQSVDDVMIRDLWTQTDRLHRARIAHRSLRAANVVVDGAARPWIMDFSFAELGATPSQIALDVVELLASLARPP